MGAEPPETGGTTMNSSYIYSRTGVSWRLCFVHAGKLLHYLTRALLMSLASAAMAVAWLFCWLDRFNSSKSPNSWMLPILPSMPKDCEQYETPAGMIRADRRAAFTIDSMIRGKAARL